MTREEKVAKLDALRKDIEVKVQAYNDAYQSRRYDESTDIDAKLTEAVNEYTALSRDICFCDCRDSGNPMIEAVRRLSYPSIALKDGKVGEAKILVREVVDRDKQIDLLKLHKFCGGIGADEQWPYMVEHFNKILTAWKATQLGIDPTEINDSYAMSKISRDINMGKTPTSNTQILKQLRMVVTAMIGEEYAGNLISHDVNFLTSVYTRKDRAALTVTCANHKYMRGYLMEICNHIITGKAYELKYKKAKNA